MRERHVLGCDRLTGESAQERLQPDAAPLRHMRQQSPPHGADGLDAAAGQYGPQQAERAVEERADIVPAPLRHSVGRGRYRLEPAAKRLQHCAGSRRSPTSGSPASFGR